ncbi:MAG: hypothetical protein ABI369_06570, partial [Acetobacteraceae bacterium]
MAGRSYLRRIAQPLVPGEPVLTPLRTPPAEDARPPVMRSAQARVARRQPAAVSAPADANASFAATTASVERTAHETASDAAAYASLDSPADASHLDSVEAADSPVSPPSSFRMLAKPRDAAVWPVAPLPPADRDDAIAAP